VASGTIEIAPDSETARLLEQVNGESVLEIKDGARFRVVRERAASKPGVHEPEGGYDPQRLIRTMHEIAGLFSEEEAERIKEYIYQGRRAGSRSFDE
jgi:hypothetical protein